MACTYSESGRTRQLRHYSTIGISDVFLEPPPIAVVPKSDDGNAYASWEIVGTIKNSPKDFVVREILSRSQRTPKLPKVGFDLVADLGTPPNSDDESKSSTVVTHSTIAHPKDLPSEPGSDSQKLVAPVEANSLKEDAAETERGRDDDDEKSPPLEIVKRILSDAFGNEEAANVLTQIERLYRRAHDDIKEYAIGRRHRHGGCCKDIVDISPLTTRDAVLGDTVTNDSGRRGPGNRGLLHRSIKLAFPLLNTENRKLDTNSEDLPQDQDANGATTDKHLLGIRVSIDDTFFGLSTCLHRPGEDIVNLCAFRNRGCIPSDNTRGGKRKREAEDTDAPSPDRCTSVLLRLRPGLPRQERRPIHHLISHAVRDFETSTISDHHGNAKDGSQVGTAVVVTWSKRARQRALRKKKKTNGQTNKRASSHSASNTLCVMKKTRTEHFQAIQRLSYAIRCRQSDIGLAGIKDYDAITFQFCSIANTSPEAVKRATSSLQGIELGRIRQVDWVLNQGDLLGNRFEIMIRNVARINVERRNGVASEVRIPCEREHVMAMVKRISNSGFVNFYGEQRVGMPGSEAEVGVRSVDIGRALLRQDFSKAIDLLMAGRPVSDGGKDIESREVRHVRQVWKQTNGDVAMTLKAMPKGNAMARERAVLKGLNRYGIDSPLAALKCLHFGLRTLWIHAYQSYVWNVMASQRLKRFGTTVVKGDLYRLPDERGVRVVGDDDLASVDIAHVVLPLPGYNIRYPENEIGAIYGDFLSKENVSFIRSAPSEATAKGGYRALIAFAQNMEVSFGSFKENEDKDGTVSEFKLTFDLPRGSYATMMIRELMLTTFVRC